MTIPNKNATFFHHGTFDITEPHGFVIQNTDPQRPKVVSGNFRSVDGDLGVEPKIGGKFPKSSHFKRRFHYFHHPFWGTNIFGNIQMHLCQTKSWTCL